tara:strand:+ start:311 stop:457 length:147 start_codon:yes stop_codon:yes gene_type:complete
LVVFGFAPLTLGALPLVINIAAAIDANGAEADKAVTALNFFGASLSLA